jgi:hypothetical protein
MNARPDCELPHHLAALGVLLLMRNDALADRTVWVMISPKEGADPNT